jgi:hypothetical protein
MPESTKLSERATAAGTLESTELIEPPAVFNVSTALREQPKPLRAPIWLEQPLSTERTKGRERSQP